MEAIANEMQCNLLKEIWEGGSQNLGQFFVKNLK